MSDHFRLSRRALLRGAGGLLVAVLFPAPTAAQTGRAAPPLNRRLSPGQLDSYLAIDSEGRITAFFGKTDMGQGVDVAIAQIVADELDAPVNAVQVIMGDSALTLHQGGASGSTAIETGARPLRSAAAEARRVLLDLAAERLRIAPEQLEITEGRVHARSQLDASLGFGELLQGRHFDLSLEWNGVYGNGLNVTGSAPLKRPEQYRVVGRSLPRRELPDIVLGRQQYIVDVRVPGMLHGRLVRPPVAGAVPLQVDAASIAGIPGAQVVHEGDFLAVVAEREWDAVRASRQLAVDWSTPEAPFPAMENLYEHIRRQTPDRESAGSGFGPDVAVDRSAFDAVLAAGGRVIEADYEFPFQSHASMGPACAVCDVRGDSATLWTGSQKPHDAAEGVAALLGVPVENVRAIWVLGPGTYGRNDAGDAAMDAALLSRATGRPVRVQGMRHEGTAWNPKAPASIHRGRAVLDEAGKLLAHEFFSKGFSAGDMAAWERSPSDTWAGMLTGWPNASVARFDRPGDRYTFPVQLSWWQTVPPLLQRASPLRTAHFRDPLGPQIHFSSESFMDELAWEANTDPFEFRLRYLEEPRDRAVLEALREYLQWQPRRAGPQGLPSGELLRGRGVAYTRRGNSVIALLAEVEVERATGRVWPRRFVIAADQGKIVNPLWLKRTLEGNILMATSRTLHEELSFTPEAVTSVDWASYPILDIQDAPAEIDFVLIDHDDLPPYGAGEPSTRTVPAAIANAIFDATGVRIRRAPFTPARVKALLDEALS